MFISLLRSSLPLLLLLSSPLSVLSQSSSSSSSSSSSHHPSLVYYNAIKVTASIAASASTRLTNINDVPFEPVFVDATNSLWFNPTITYQPILGFGGAITDAATGVISKLPTELQQEIVNAYYSDEEGGAVYGGNGSNGGNKYSLGRVHINSCDFSPYSYSFDDVVDDFNLNHFDQYVTHDNATMIPFIQHATNTNPHMKLFATPWSPPAWMKGNDKMTGSSSPCLKPDAAYHTAWADYIVKFFESYSNHYGINFWGMTVQNEPEFDAPWEACQYSAEEEGAFVADFLGPIMKNNDLTKDIKLIAYDHNKDHVHLWADALYSDPEVSKWLWGTGVHWYSGDEFDHLETVHSHWPAKHLFASEACNCPGVNLGDWSRGEKYAHDIIGDLNHFVEGWTDWNIVLDQTGGPNHLGNNCDAPIIAHLDENPMRLTYQPTYFVMGHFSRFLPPGAVRLHHEMSDWDGNVELVCFLVDSVDKKKQVGEDEEGRKVMSSGKDVIIIVLNQHDVDTTLKVKVANQAARVPVAKHSILTLQFDAALL